jgi:outer membrane usher protein
MPRRLIVAIALALAAQEAGAAGPAVPDAFAEAVLQVTINGEQVPTALVVRRDSDGALLVKAGDLKTLRLKTPLSGGMLVNGQRYYRIGKEIGATVSFDDASQSVDINLPPQAFVASRTSAAADSAPPKVTISPGAFVNYDLNAERSGRSSSAGGFFEAGIFGAKGVLTSTAYALAESGDSRAVRLDTTWTRDFPDRLTTLRVGDAVSSTGPWGRSVRFGGIQYGTNFNTQPTLVTTPLLSARGDAVVPSTVDVFVNGQQVASEQVQPGPFEIDGVPTVNGAGQMQVVVTDTLGRQQVIAQPYYSGQSLLRKGLTEYSVEAGAVRRDYTERSNAYGDVVAAATFRRGVSDNLTAGVHAEAQSKGSAAAGVDASVQVGDLGIVSGSVAAGGDSNSTGWLGGVGFERNGRRGSVYARSLYASEGFSQLGDSVLPDRPKLRTFAGVGVDLFDFGSLQLAYGLQTNWTTPSSETFGLGYTYGLGSRGFLNLFASHSTSEESEPESDIYLTWTMPMGDRRTASASLSHRSEVDDQGGFEADGTLQQSLPVGSGTGYLARISSANRGNLGLAYQGSAGAIGVDYARANGQDGVRVGGNGGLAITGAGVMPARRLSQSFAVVKLADYEGIEVFVDNQPVGRTDRKGRVLLDNLLPYQANEISVNPNRLPMDAKFQKASMTVTPAYRSGAVVRFPVSRANAVTLRLIQPGGVPVPAGAEVRLDGNRYPVGMRGSMFLSGLGGPTQATATWRDGSCTFSVARPAGKDPLPDVGEVQCVPTPTH